MANLARHERLADVYESLGDLVREQQTNHHEPTHEDFCERGEALSELTARLAEVGRVL